MGRGSTGQRGAGVVLAVGFILLIEACGRVVSGKIRSLPSRSDAGSVCLAQTRHPGGAIMSHGSGDDGSVFSRESNDGLVGFGEEEGTPFEGGADWILRLRAWCEQDPEAMVSWVVGNLRGEDRETALKQAAVVWVRKDPEIVIRWAETLPEGKERNAVLLEISFELARLKPERAVDLAFRLPRSATRDELVVHAVRQWAGIDPVAASRWASDLPASRLRQEVFSALAVSLAVDSGEDAAGVVALSMTVDRQQEDAAVLVARHWGMTDPESSAAWAVGFPDPEVRGAALLEIVSGWAVRSPERMSMWIDSLTDESLRNQVLSAVDGLRGRMEISDPETSVDIVP